MAFSFWWVYKMAVVERTGQRKLFTSRLGSKQQRETWSTIPFKSKPQ
jgi:hypothetical protein